MRVLIACECSGVVRRAFRERGHDAWSCDLQPADDKDPYHIQGDALKAIADGCPDGQPWDLLSRPATPGKVWGEDRRKAMREAAKFFRAMLDCGVPRRAIENPVPHGEAQALLGPYSQTWQPYDFGDKATKNTCFWLRNLPPLQPTHSVGGGDLFNQAIEKNADDLWDNQWAGVQKDGKPKRWDLAGNIGDRKLRAKVRSQTFAGVARAMAEQWGALKPLSNCNLPKLTPDPL